MLKPSYAVFKKEIKQELRTKYALNTLLAFTGSSLLLILFTLRAQLLDPLPKSGLVWIIILFAAMSGMVRTFVQETDKKTWILLRLHTRATSVYLGKVTYNFFFLLLLHLFTFFFYMLMMDLNVVSAPYLIAVIVFGAAGLASVTTLLSAMIAQADKKGALFSVLCIPLMVPLLLILTSTTTTALIDGPDSESVNNLMALVGYCGVTFTAGVLLFDYIWED